MQSNMGMMHSLWMGGAMGCCGAGQGHGHMRGPMWNDYSKLTPEQLKHRQYMMDRWMPMQQRMMDHMMQHQHWMMQSPQPQAPSR